MLRNGLQRRIISALSGVDDPGPKQKAPALKPTYPLPVHHSWPLYERDRFFELGQLHGADTLDPIPDVVDVAAPAAHEDALGRVVCAIAAAVSSAVARPTECGSTKHPSPWSYNELGLPP